MARVTKAYSSSPKTAQQLYHQRAMVIWPNEADDELQTGRLFMWGTSKIKAIAEANQPAFASASAMQWWLDAGPTRPDPVPPVRVPAKPVLATLDSYRLKPVSSAPIAVQAPEPAVQVVKSVEPVPASPV